MAGRDDVIPLEALAPAGRTALSTFVPPPRFADTHFRDYQPQHPSQGAALERVEGFIEALASGPRRRWPWQAPTPGRGLYLDGGFGVGKTHLLAAAFNDSDLEAKAYLSFQELVYAIGVLGRAEAQRTFAPFRLVLLDEFELDDPGNTLIVKTFLADLFARGGSAVTTSNTSPEAQGRGRFNAADFQREIQSIAERFAVVPIDGPDFRHRDRLSPLPSETELDARLATEEAARPRVAGDWTTLLGLLRDTHPIRYRGLLDQIGTLYVRGAAPIPDQNDALRFVHFIDKLYDLRVGFRLAGATTLPELFHPSYRAGAFQKKYDRCLSRLSELLDEPVAVGAKPAGGR